MQTYNCIFDKYKIAFKGLDIYRRHCPKPNFFRRLKNEGYIANYATIKETYTG